MQEILGAEFGTVFTFVLASIAILIVPGPTVTVIIANSLRYGARAGLINIAGTQLGLILLLGLLALGLEALTTTLAWVFDWVRLAGAAYLIWLGYKFIRSDGMLVTPSEDAAAKPDKSMFWQGFIVVLSNPKVLVFFGAFLPQFIDPAGNTALQTMAFGLLFMGLATLLDSAYAIAAGRAGGLLTQRNIRLAENGAGTMMIGGGLWLALSRN